MAANMNSSSSDMATEMTELPSTDTDGEVNPSEIAEDITPSTIIDIPAATIPSKGKEIEEKAGEVNKKEEQASNIASTSAQPLTRPIPDLLYDKRGENYSRFCLPLFQASITGNWAAAKDILEVRPEMVRYSITKDHNTPLHVAASAGNTKLMEKFVKNLVELMRDDDMRLQNGYNNTALWLAAADGHVKIARLMVNKNNMILSICGNGETFPLYIAAVNEREEMVKYLFEASSKKLPDEDGWTSTQRGLFLQKCVECDLFDVALEVASVYPELTINESIMRTLAGKPDALYTVKRSFIFRVILSIKVIDVGPAEIHSDALKLLRFSWRNLMLKPKLEVDRIIRGPLKNASSDQTSENIQYTSGVLFVAAEAGNTRFLVELFQTYPDVLLIQNDDNLSIFHIAIMHRHQGIYNLLYEMGSMKDRIVHLKDKDNNNMLHLVGMTSKKMRPHMVEASLIMQRELLWFKAVEKMLPPRMRKEKNRAGQTPYELFSENNKDVVSEGLKWIKDCMVVATLIVTVAFTVAFTVPGGYNQIHGVPFFIHRSTFVVFVVADAICLFSSSASLLLFLSILISHHNQRHFLSSLPKKLMTALFFLFISVVAIMVTFSASFFVLYHNGLRWVAFLISIFVAIPVIIFAMLQIPVLVDICRSVYDNRYLFNPRSRMLYVIPHN